MFLFIIISLFFSLGLKCGFFFYHVGFFNFADLVPFWPQVFLLASPWQPKSHKLLNKCMCFLLFSPFFFFLNYFCRNSLLFLLFFAASSEEITCVSLIFIFRCRFSSLCFLCFFVSVCFWFSCWGSVWVWVWVWESEFGVRLR